jgi:hypothetical protein
LLVMQHMPLLLLISFESENRVLKYIIIRYKRVSECVERKENELYILLVEEKNERVFVFS